MLNLLSIWTAFIFIALIFLSDTSSVFAAKSEAFGEKAIEKKLKMFQDTIDISSDNRKILDFAFQYNSLAQKQGNRHDKLKGHYNIGVASWQNNDFIRQSNIYIKATNLLGKFEILSRKSIPQFISA